jgi:hypothetical protein
MYDSRRGRTSSSSFSYDSRTTSSWATGRLEGWVRRRHGCLKLLAQANQILQEGWWHSRKAGPMGSRGKGLGDGRGLCQQGWSTSPVHIICGGVETASRGGFAVDMSVALCRALRPPAGTGKSSAGPSLTCC